MLDNFNNFDCLNLISKNLSCIDILCFKYTCKYLSLNIILPNFKDIFIKRLLEGNVVPTIKDALQFCDNLYNTRAYVAGSFILDCLYNTNYHNDIDIYDQTGLDNRSSDIYWFDKDNKTNLKFTQTLYKLGFTTVGNISETDGHLRSFINNSNPECVYNNNPKKHAYKRFDIKTRRCKNNIQIIPIDLKLIDNERSTIPRFIKSTFDLDICQNYFDGINLYIKNIDKLIYKYDFIKPNTKFMRQVYYIENEDELKNRLEDKNELGNELENEDESKIMIVDYNNQEYYENKNTENRVNKYINRGFDVKYHPKYDEIKLYIQEKLENNKHCKVHTCLSSGNCTYQNHYRDNIRLIADNSINLSIYDF